MDFKPKALFSRGTRPNPLGKNTAELRILVPEELQQKLQALAVLRNTNVSDYLRDLLMEHVYGRVYILRQRMDGENME